MRIHWEIPGAGGDHVLDVLPAVVGSRVHVRLDGVVALDLRKPTPQSPWQYGELQVDDEIVGLALIWNVAGMHTDLFRNGSSNVDGRSIDEARASAPTPMTGYQLWFHGSITGVSSSRVMPPGLRVAVGCAIAGILAAGLLRFPNLVEATVLEVSFVIMMVAYLWGWAVVTARANRHLLGHPEFGDVRRVVAIGAVFLGFPVVTALVIAGAVALARMLA